MNLMHVQGIIYDKDILNKIILLSEDQTQIKKSIKESVEKLQNSYEANYRAFKEQIIKLRDQFYESHGLYRLVPNYFEGEDYDVNKDMNDWKSGPGFTSLHSIKQGKEFRRNEAVEQIKKTA